MQLYLGKGPGSLKVETYYGQREGHRQRGTCRGEDPLHCNAELLTFARVCNAQFVAFLRPTKTTNEMRPVGFHAYIPVPETHGHTCDDVGRLSAWQMCRMKATQGAKCGTVVPRDLCGTASQP